MARRDIVGYQINVDCSHKTLQFEIIGDGYLLHTPIFM